MARSKKPSPVLAFEVAGDLVPVYVDDVTPNANPDESLFGYYILGDAGDSSIHISDKIEDPLFFTKIVLHELIHAVDYATGLKLKHKQVHGLGNALAVALKPYLTFIKSK
jgi:hypothetical protein